MTLGIYNAIIAFGNYISDDENLVNAVEVDSTTFKNSFGVLIKCDFNILIDEFKKKMVAYSKSTNTELLPHQTKLLESIEEVGKRHILNILDKFPKPGLPLNHYRVLANIQKVLNDRKDDKDKSNDFQILNGKQVKVVVDQNGNSKTVDLNKLRINELWNPNSAHIKPNEYEKKYTYKAQTVQVSFISLVAETRGGPNEAYAWKMDKTMVHRAKAKEQLSKMFDVGPDAIMKGYDPV